MLKLENVAVRFGEQTIVDHVSFSLKEGQWLMLAGPNGAGKSTLIHAVSQGVPYEGKIWLGERDIRSFRPAQLARKIGVLSQKNNVSYSYTVDEIVGLGRYAHTSGFFSGGDDAGEERVNRALRLTGLEELRHHNVLTLSGGELQRTFLAQVFAQDPEILILDEPANHLDLVYQKLIFSLIQQWLQTPGRAVVSVVHDLSLARRYGTDAVLMSHGKCIAQGAIDDVLTADNLRRVYNMDVYEWMQEMLGQWSAPSK